MNVGLAVFTVCALFVAIAAQYRRRSYWILGSIALAAHLAVGFYVVPRLPYNWDILNFHSAAMAILGGGFPGHSTTVAAFGTFQAILYIVFEPRVEVMTAFSSLFAVLLPLPACYVATKLYPSAVVSTRGLLAVILFIPTPFFFMGLPMRDSFSVLVAFSIVALVVYAYDAREVWPVVVSLPALGMLFLVRPELALIVAMGGASGAVVFTLNTLFNRHIPLRVVSVAIAPVGLVGAYLGSRLFPFERLAAEAAWRAQGGAAYLEWIEYESATDMALTAPTRAIFFQFAPFPLQVDTAFHALPLVTFPLLVVCTVGAYRSLTACRLDTVVATTVLVVYLGGVVGYGIVTSNFGTSVRHRMMFTYLLVVFAAPVIERWERLLTERFGVREKDERDEPEQPKETQKLDGSVDVGP